jgi:hypothetical protein
VSVQNYSGALTGRSAPRADIATAHDLLSRPEWLLDDLDLAAGVATFTEVDRTVIERQVFLDDWDRAGRVRRTLPLTALAEAKSPPRPAAFIWHTAFCCSTLLADCLDTPGVALALKEPWVLAKLADGRRTGTAAGDLTRHVLALLGRGFEPSERVMIKPSNGTNTLLGTDRIGAPALLLYASCRDFLAAVASGGPVIGGGELRKGFVRALLSQRALSHTPLMRWSAEALCGLTDLQAAAILWHVQVGEFRAYAGAGGTRVRSLDCARFLTDPADTLINVDALFELGAPAARWRDVAAGPKMRRYAKKPDQPFDAARRQAVFEQVNRAFGRTLDAIVDWSFQMCPETPLGDPVGAPL